MDRSPLTMPRQLPRCNPGQKVLLWLGVLGKLLHNPVVSCNGGRELGGHQPESPHHTDPKGAAVLSPQPAQAKKPTIPTLPRAMEQAARPMSPPFRLWGCCESANSCDRIWITCLIWDVLF